MLESFTILLMFFGMSVLLIICLALLGCVVGFYVVIGIAVLLVVGVLLRVYCLLKVCHPFCPRNPIFKNGSKRGILTRGIHLEFEEERMPREK